MTGYVRQSSYSDGNTITAAHTNDEFNALVLAMLAGTGHKHDGSAAEGGYVPLISNTANTRKVEVTASGALTTGDHEVTGNIVVTGTVDGRDVATDGTKLDGIESAATADQTGAEIKVAYEAEADTNAYTDAAVTKLAGIETAATADQTGAEIKSLYELEADTNAFTDADHSKLDGIEAAATADQTGAEIKIAYEGEANTNAFTDAEQTKLAGIETSATADQVASEVPFTPTGTVAATDVQAAIAELDTEKSATGHTHLEADITDLDKYTQAQVDSALALKANLVSPALTGTPTAPTATLGDNSTQIATTAYVTANAAGAYPGGITGLVPSNAADADHDITISTGRCRDSLGAEDIILSSTITKQIDATWVEGNNLGGLFSGSVAADTTYHMFLIVKDIDGTVDSGFDTSLSAANIPAGWTAFRRVFSFLTDSSSNIPGFLAVEANGGGVDVVWNDSILDLNTTAPGTSGVLLTLSVPTGFPLLAQIRAKMSDASTVEMLFTSPHQTDIVPSVADSDLRVSASGTQAGINRDILTDSSGRMRYRSSLGSGLSFFSLHTIGWNDSRRV